LKEAGKRVYEGGQRKKKGSSRTEKNWPARQKMRSTKAVQGEAGGGESRDRKSLTTPTEKKPLGGVKRGGVAVSPTKLMAVTRKKCEKSELPEGNRGSRSVPVRKKVQGERQRGKQDVPRQSPQTPLNCRGGEGNQKCFRLRP